MAEGGGTRRRSLGMEDDEDEERAKEIEGLQKRGILPSDFPVRAGDLETFDDNDMTQEVEELLSLGEITKEEAEELTNKEDLAHEVCLDALSDPHVADHEQMMPPFASDGVPLNWSRDVGTDKLYSLVKLKKGEPEFDIIAKEFERVNIKIKGIERIQSNRSLKRFQDELEDVHRHRNETFSPNIRYLYHGTSVEKDRICEEGLDQRLSRMGYFGKGIYFSDNPLKCVHYSDDPAKKNPDEAYILKCRVILGDAKVYAKGCYDTTLKREPEKEASSSGWRYYDSVVGCPKDFNEFVVYENRRAMIEYIISFKVDKKMMTDLRSQSVKKVSTQNPTTAGATVKRNSGAKSPDDHFARIAEVREAVRKKRLEEAGKSYIPPSQKQQEHDKDMWTRLQTLHRLNEKMNSQGDGEPDENLGGEMCEPVLDLAEPPTVFSKLRQTNKTKDVKSEAEQSEEAVQKVLKGCIAHFLEVTDTDDSKLARYYVQKANMDVNHAISLYYEDIG
ncbi:uncharacterized protein LOC123531352 [Mercenaria mercenaria]|uniref:uncharacterized protein LOC123531352 n=1 Tax=Mercenaria mercenaria TaxID=6596 RepID=UPI00234F14C3|nr:uncharacterized protein LOC123531352 [Mercenaria mercenaria]